MVYLDWCVKYEHVFKVFKNLKNCNAELSASEVLLISNPKTRMPVGHLLTPMPALGISKPFHLSWIRRWSNKRQWCHISVLSEILELLVKVNFLFLGCCFLERWASVLQRGPLVRRWGLSSLSSPAAPHLTRRSTRRWRGSSVDAMWGQRNEKWLQEKRGTCYHLSSHSVTNGKSFQRIRKLN